MAALVFWTCSVLLAYVYVLYPILAEILAAKFGVAPKRGSALPSVTIIVTAYNEERCIRGKLDNLASLNYPPELVDVIVASDGSSDTTETIAASYDPARVRVLRLEGRRGKTACQNAAAAAAGGEILVFTDATTHLHQETLRRLVENFADSEVGCVGGRLVYVSDVNNVTGRGGEAYWSYEVRLRVAESLLGSMIGVSGCLYAVRRSAYRPIDPELISDFVIAMNMQEQGLRAVLATDAICFEETLDRGSHELAMRVRVAIRSLNALISERRFLNPFQFGRFAWQLWSHKVLRYASPLLWIGALASNSLLVYNLPYLVLLLGQCALISAGAIGFLLQGRHRALGLFGRPYYFLLTNIAALIATLRYLRGERMVTWQPMRETPGAPQL
jgi:cellulose synthase/poly-beta-1,6-N-acetylglucosamine synthase-like glycosyltransferase